MRYNKIFDAFPTPQFLDIPFAGLSISDGAVRCIQFGKKNGALYIIKYIERPVAAGVITDGEVNNPEELVHILETLKKDLNLSYVKVSIPEEKAYLFTAKIPMLLGNEVKSAIESKIEENVPVPPGELLFDYQLSEHHEENHLDVVVSALQISVANTYVDIVNKAGLRLLSLEIVSQAITRALLSPDDPGTTLIIHFGQEKAGLYISTGAIVHFTSTIITKGNANSPEILAQEIKKLFAYWHTLKDNVKNPDRKIQQIIICGENFPDTVIPFLSAHIGVKVLLGNVWRNVFDLREVVPEISFEDSLRYSSAIGLALPAPTLV